jgi:hypothetical protein
MGLNVFSPPAAGRNEIGLFAVAATFGLRRVVFSDTIRL